MIAKRLVPLTLLLALAYLLGATPAVRAAEGGTATLDVQTQSGLLAYLLTWLLPLGVALVAVGLSQASRAYHVATALPLALAAALGGYALCGFALQFGGVGLVTDNPALAGWIAEWSPLDLTLGDGWGLLGLHGFMLPSTLMTPTAWNLFLAQLPLVATAALLPLLALDERIPRLPGLFLAFLVAAVVYPLMGNWLCGGGWLSHLGQTLSLGQGYRDDGLVSLYLVGAGAALAGITALKSAGRGRPRIAEPELPRAYLPLNVLAGAFLALLGWCAVLFNRPLGAALDPLAGLPRLFAAVAGSVLAASFYGWLVHGRPDAGLTGRAMLAAVILVSAGLRSIPVWGAALSGAVCGLLLAPAMYLVEHVLHLDDRAATLSVHGLSALAGVLMVAALEGGVSQLYAQLLGVAALALLSALMPWALLVIIARAYTLPAALSALARAQSDEWANARLVRAQRRLQGQLPSLLQRLNRLYRRRAAVVARRLMARPLP